MKHILFIHSSAELYGSDRSLLYLIKQLNKKKFKITVLLPCNGPLSNEISKIQNVQVKIYEVAVLRRKNLSLRGILAYLYQFCNSCKYIKKLIKKEKIDIVYTNTAVVFPGAVVAKLNKVKSVWHIREIIKNSRERFVISKMVQLFADVIIANSYATGNAICRDSSKVKVVYNAVENKEIFVQHKEKTEVIIGMAGRINRWKGQRLFIDVAQIVHEKRENVKFKIAGAAYGGEEYMEEDLKKYISDKGLEDKVILLGQVTDMDAFYLSLDIFVLPSIQPEPFGLVVTEAMEMKLPIIATNHGGPVEIIRDGKDGYLVDYRSAEEMATRCLALIDDWKLRKQMGENGWRRKREIFSLEQTVAGIEKVLEDL